MACEAMKRNRKTGMLMPCQPSMKATATKLSETMYPIEPIIIKILLPTRSIRYKPSKVKIKFVAPIPILLSNAALSFRPAVSKILGA